MRELLGLAQGPRRVANSGDGNSADEIKKKERGSRKKSPPEEGQPAAVGGTTSSRNAETKEKKDFSLEKEGRAW